jgi:hypothetical protein
MNRLPQYAILRSRVDVQLLRGPIQVIIGTKSMDVLRHRDGTPPKADLINALMADPEEVAPKAEEEEVA